MRISDWSSDVCSSDLWEAYESTGNCVMLAGPGSGKTKTLTVKLARMLCEDVEAPRGIACITFNNECARELENRLDALGVDSGGRVLDRKSTRLNSSH